VATISRLLKIIGLFCKRAPQRVSSAKETYNFKGPANCSHPILYCSVLHCVTVMVCCSVLRCVAVAEDAGAKVDIQGVVVCRGVLWCVAVCCSVLQCAAVCCGVLLYPRVRARGYTFSVLECIIRGGEDS